LNSGLISISVVDRTKKREGGASGENRQHHTMSSEDRQEREDVSVTVVERKKRQSSPDGSKEKRRREDAPLPADSRLMRVESDATVAPEMKDHHPDPIVTISKVSAVKAATPKPPETVSVSPGPQADAAAATAARRTPVSSPSVQTTPLHQPGSYSMFAQRMRGPPHPPLGPRGGLMMMGHPPPRGFIMRGGFRAGGPRGAGPLALPSLQPRPPPAGPMPTAVGFPSSAGPVAEQLNRVAGQLADYMKHSLEDLFRDLSQQAGGSPEATIKGLQLECEKMAWRHQQELAEVKHNADLVLMEMRGSLEQEKQRALHDCRQQAELEKLSAVAEAKKKQWCANCGKEAIFYCCWNTSYCDYPCQQAHWPAHMTSCSQNSEAGGGGGGGAMEEDPMTMVQGHIPAPPPHFLAGGSQGRLMPMHMGMGGGGVHMHHDARMAAAATMAGMRFSMRPNLAGQMAFTRPYFM